MSLFSLLFLEVKPFFRNIIVHSLVANMVSSAFKGSDNEKCGGSGSWQVFEDGFGPWRSMSVYFLMVPSSFL
jgi:hypothetical protein